MTNLDFMVSDGGTLLLAVPVIVAAWILVVAFLDRGVRKGVDRESAVSGDPGQAGAMDARPGPASAVRLTH